MNEADVAAPDQRIFYLGDESTLCMGVLALLQPRGIALDAFENLDDLESSLRRRRPRALILDLRHISSGTRPGSLIERLVGGDPNPPEVVCIAEEESIETRLEVMRAGARGYFPSPLVLSELAERLSKLAGPAKVTQPKILVVEDDPVQTKYIVLLLANKGMEPHLVDQPLQILEQMHDVKPDLILMDLCMPGVSGAELTAIIRDHDAFFDTPIVFLSAETDLAKQIDGLKVGGDSFITKPINRDQLIGAVEHRVRMSRWLRERRVTADRRDIPGGLVPKDVFLRRLDRLVHSSEPPPDGVGLLLVALDRPQDVFVALGVKGMECLLGQLEGKLAQHLLAEECAVRLDDFTFALLARRDTGHALEELGTQLLHLFSATKPRVDDQRLAITVTIRNRSLYAPGGRCHYHGVAWPHHPGEGHAGRRQPSAAVEARDPAGARRGL
jgi:DNA-binding response OmpR family regulator